MSRCHVRNALAKTSTMRPRSLPRIPSLTRRQESRRPPVNNDADVLMSLTDLSAAANQIGGSLNARTTDGDTSHDGTVPTIVPETRQNSVSRANGSQLA